MNYRNPEKVRKILQAATRLGFFCAPIFVIILTLSVIFYTPKTNSQSLPACSTISGTAQAGVNCLYYPPLPLCTSTIKDHRKNCADLIDLPLCDQIDGTNLPGKNCVKECSDPSMTGTSGIRGQDYAIHNVSCIRFCDTASITLENTNHNTSGANIIVANQGVNCVGRACHQLQSTTDPDPDSNCNMLDCNLLTPDELNEVKFRSDAKKYCEGDGVKCYNFTQSQLPYVLYRINNKMCTIHDCKPSSTTCGADDTLNVSSKGIAYENTYIAQVNGGLPLTNTSLCNQIICAPVVYRQYRCEPYDAANPTTKPSGNICDADSVCSAGYCTKKIDCNLSQNDNEAECIASEVTETSVGSTADTMDSWFYRPKPMSKSMSGYNFRQMSNNACYTFQDLKDNGFANHVTFTVLGVEIDLGWYHDYLGMDSRSPGMCGHNPGSSDGSRGNGYIYLCGNNSLLYGMANGSTAFHKGYVRTDFEEGDATHVLNVCLRFNNAMVPGKTCGTRECGITYSSSNFWGQACGRDVCYDLTLKDSDPDECMMDSWMFKNDGGDKGCAQTVDHYLRLRAVKYQNKICTFLDLKGTLAYDPNYFTGNEKLADGTCLSGTADTNGNCSGGKNTNDEKTLAERWRTVVRIPYIENNRQAGQPRGYLDLNGQLFREQDCIKTPLRISPPRMFNLATVQNSDKLFSPPIYIKSASVKRGGIVSQPGHGEDYGKTDFHYPELELQFGLVTKILSLGIGYTGYEASGDGDSLGSATVETTYLNNSLTYSAEVFVRKEVNTSTLEPEFCLYRRVRDETNAELAPFRIGCVKRNYPDINNIFDRQLNSALDPHRMVVSADAANTFDSSKIVIRYLAGFGANNVDNSCTGDDATYCTTSLSLLNADASSPTCDSTKEKYQICAQRDECSKLNVECMKNEIDMQVAKNSGQSIDSFLAVRKNCNEVLLPICNARKGYSSDSAATITNPNPNNATPIANAYGWYNEICLVSGFETKLRKVLAYEVASGVRGKCVIDLSKSTGACTEGGKAPNCICLQAFDDTMIPDGQIVRMETAHEAGLCVDMPLPKTCPAIDYNLTPNSDINDLEYVNASLDKIASAGYGTGAGNVHISHQYRSIGKTTAPTIPMRGHAEFPLAVFGQNDVEGVCKGYWREKVVGGIKIPPKLSCLNNSGEATWETLARDECIRYTCPAVTTTGPDETGSYQGGYGASEISENKGSFHGFATWPEHTQTTDFAESQTATACIPGFKKIGSVMQKSTGSVTDATQQQLASMYNQITGYLNGTTPVRNCNQVGQYAAATNSCERISCPALLSGGLLPANPGTDLNKWAYWANSGGATFPSVLASRSSIRTQSESIATGTCNEALGFYQNPNGLPPKRECDYLGNWKPVTNPCVTECNLVNATDGLSDNNGYAKWKKVTGVPIGGSLPGVFDGCAGTPGEYVPYPYPPFKDNEGNALPAATANDLTRPATNPERLCKSKTIAGSEDAVAVWTSTSSRCIKQCPGSSMDPRIGVGITRHNLSTGGYVDIEWESANFGTTLYKYSNDDVDDQTVGVQHSAAQYDGTRSIYILSRTCGSDGKWSAVTPHCATSGTIGLSNATFNSPSNSTPVGSTITATSCNSGYYYTGHNNTADSNRPKYTCSYSTQNPATNEYYVDKLKYNPVDASKYCIRYCEVTANENLGGNSKFVGTLPTNGLAPVGTEYTGDGVLECRSNYGSREGSTRSNGIPDDLACGRTDNTKRTSQYPKVKCGSDGEWAIQSVSGNSTACTACHGCDIDSDAPDYDSTDSGEFFYADGNCSNYNIYSKQLLEDCDAENTDDAYFNAANGECRGITFEVHKDCKNGDGNHRTSDRKFLTTIKCLDGEWKGTTGKNGASTPCSLSGNDTGKQCVGDYDGYSWH